MHNKYTKQINKQFDVRDKEKYKQDIIGASKSYKTRVSYLQPFFDKRVEVLRSLYEKYTPRFYKEWVLPEGETDGRKAVPVERYIDPPVSPFDVSEFNEVMPSIEDYIDVIEDKIYEEKKKGS